MIDTDSGLGNGVIEPPSFLEFLNIEHIQPIEYHHGLDEVAFEIEMTIGQIVCTNTCESR